MKTVNTSKRICIYSEPKFLEFMKNHEVCIPDRMRKDVSGPCNPEYKKFVIDGFTEIVRIFQMIRYDDGTFYLDIVCDILHETGTDRYYHINSYSSSSRTRTMYSLSVFHETCEESRRFYDIRFKEPEPNRMGVITRQKICTWLDYLARKAETVRSYWDKIDSHRASFEQLATQKGYRIDWISYTQGSIDKGRFRFDFHITQDGISYASLSVIPGRKSITFDDFDRLQQAM